VTARSKKGKRGEQGGSVLSLREGGEIALLPRTGEKKKTMLQRASGPVQKEGRSQIEGGNREGGKADLALKRKRESLAQGGKRRPAQKNSAGPEKKKPLTRKKRGGKTSGLLRGEGKGCAMGKNNDQKTEQRGEDMH